MGVFSMPGKPFTLRYLLLFLSLVLLVACQPAPPATAVATSTPLPSEGPSPFPSQATEQPTSPPTSTPTVNPSPTPPTATVSSLRDSAQQTLPPFHPFPVPDGSQAKAAITADNADQVAELARWGLGFIQEVQVSTDGSRLAVRTAVGVSLLDARSLQEVSFFEIPADVPMSVRPELGVSHLMDFSPDGKVLAVAVAEKAYLLNAADGALLDTFQGEGENYALSTVAFSPDGDLLAAGEGWSTDVNIWRVPDGKLVQTWKEVPPAWLVFSPDGKFLVSSNGQVHSLLDGSLLFNIGSEDYGLSQAVFSPDGKVLAANAVNYGPDAKLGLWQVETGKQLGAFDWAAAIQFSSDSQTMTFVTCNGQVQTVSISDGSFVSSSQLKDAEFASNCTASFAPDAPLLLVVSPYESVQVWNLLTGQSQVKIDTRPGQLQIAKFSADGQTLLTADVQGVQTWQASDGAPLGSQRFGYPAPILSPDGKTLVTGLDPLWAGIQVWQANSGKWLYSLEEARLPLAFSLDGSLLAVSQASGPGPYGITDTIQVLRVSDGSLVDKLTEQARDVEPIRSSLEFSPDGSLLAEIQDFNLIVWKIGKQKPLYQVAGADEGLLLNLAFSPDGQTLATGNAYHTVQIWRVSDGTKLQTLPMEPTEVMGESGEVRKLAFAPDGELLVATD